MSGQSGDAASDRPKPVGPPNALVVPRFAGPDTFARLPRLDDLPSAAVAVVGVPFDAGTSYRSGTRFGPAAIRAGSKLLRTTRTNVADYEIAQFSLAQEGPHVRALLQTLACLHELERLDALTPAMETSLRDVESELQRRQSRPSLLLAA